MTQPTFPPPQLPQPAAPPRRSKLRTGLIVAAVAVAGIVWLAPDNEPDQPTPQWTDSELLDLSWSTLTPTEQNDLCDGAEALGFDAAYQAFNSDADEARVSRSDFAAFLDRKCP